MALPTGLSLTPYYRLRKKRILTTVHFRNLKRDAQSKTEREIYESGLDYLAHCNEHEKLKIFGILYRLSEVDGRVHAKEIKLLLYSVNTAGIEFNDVVDYAKRNPSIF